MPAVIIELLPVLAVWARAAIIFIVQTGAWLAAEKYLVPAINKLIATLAGHLGGNQEEAQKILGNKYLQMAESLGIGIATLKSKTPIKVAEALGFTTRGFSKAKLATTLGMEIEAKLGVESVAKIAGEKEATAIAKQVAATGVSKLDTATKLIKLISITITIPVGTFYMFAQYIDFANWQGPYQKTFQKLLALVGIHPDTPLPSSKVISPETWKRILATVNEAHPIGLSFPASGKDTIYNQENLAKLVDEVAAQITLGGGDATYKNVLGALLPLIHLSGQPFTETPYTVTAPVKTTTTTAQPVKVFIGTVSQGYLASGNTFTPRENDLIESTAELTESAHNNLVPFITSLPSRITYELKVVSSVVDADGFRRVGTTQQVVSGTDANGKPKYRTVTNKFAVLDLYIKTNTGSRSKISSIVLGPVDSARLQISASDLASLSTSLKSNVVTTQTSEVSNVAGVGSTILPATVSASSDTVTPILTPGMFRAVGDFGSAIYARIGNKIFSANLLDHDIFPQINGVIGAGKQAEIVLPILKQKYALDWNALPALNVADLSNDDTIIKTGKAGPEGGPDPFVRSVSLSDFAALRDSGPSELSAITRSKSATNLRDYYAILGQDMPSIEIRSVQYENFGLGNRAYYTGTAEQNTKLLSKLQGK